jgi:hypothetical protein
VDSQLQAIASILHCCWSQVITSNVWYRLMVERSVSGWGSQLAIVGVPEERKHLCARPPVNQMMTASVMGTR